MLRTRVLAALLLTFILAIALTSIGAEATPSSPPPFVQRNLPGAGHQVFKALAGTWDVETTSYGAGASREHPLVAPGLVAKREIVGGGRYLRDETTGVVGGQPYWRIGVLAYSNVDRRYEWVTQDGVNTTMMYYLGKPGSGPTFPAELLGTFTDPGIVSEKTLGKPIGQRTVFQIDGPDQHTVLLYFRPPGGKEVLFDKKVYTRAK